MAQEARRMDDVMTEIPKGMLLISQEHYNMLLQAYEREIDKMCLEAIKRIEARKAAGTYKTRPAREFFAEFEAKHGIKI